MSGEVGNIDILNDQREDNYAPRRGHFERPNREDKAGMAPVCVLEQRVHISRLISVHSQAPKEKVRTIHDSLWVSKWYDSNYGLNGLNDSYWRRSNSTGDS